jgi:hypothetical protein
MLFALLALTIAFHHRHSTAALAVTYPAGWNLVSGPEGSHLMGASGNLYTLQPGDSEYEIVPATSALHGGWGYWAYFATAGSLQASPGSAAVSLRLTPGQWTMIGNPSAELPVTVSGADIVLVRPPGADYQATTTIAVGQGAWATGRATASLAVQPPGAPAAPSASSELGAQPISVTVAADLKAVALQPSDLQGYALAREDFPNTQVGYVAVWTDSDPNSSHYTVTNVLFNADSVSTAESALSDWEKLTRQDADNYNVQFLGSQGVGDHDRSISYNVLTARGVELDEFAVTFRRGTVVVTIDVADVSGTGSLARAVALAQVIDRRLLQRAGGSGVTAPSALPVQSGGGRLLLPASGYADDNVVASAPATVRSHSSSQR